MTTTPSRIAAALAYLSCIVGANWLTAHYGLVPVGLGLVVTAGTFAAGLSFVARDLLQDAAGRAVVLGAILLGAGLSALLAPWQLAVASGLTFVVSESADGDTAWKLGAEARALVPEAHRRGVWVHMGRVNSLRRLAYADAIGCDSADGTYLAYGPDTNLPKLLGWLRHVDQPVLFQGGVA